VVRSARLGPEYDSPEGGGVEPPPVGAFVVVGCGRLTTGVPIIVGMQDSRKNRENIEKIAIKRG
jgi:hypothetical protein